MKSLYAAWSCFVSAVVIATAVSITPAATLEPRATSETKAPARVGAWQTLRSMEAARAQPTAVADPVNKKIYVMGGYEEEFGTPLDVVEVYDPATDLWTSGPSLPIPTRGAAGVYYNGKIYLFGGATVDAEPSVQVLNIAKGAWTVVPFANASWEAGAAVVGDKIYVGGGDSKHESQLFEVDPTTLAATPKANSTIGHKLYDLLALDGALYAVAGINTGFSAHSVVERYDPATDTWSDAPADLPSERCTYAGGAIGNFLFVAGGSTILFNGRTPRFNTLFFYDVTTGEWAEGPIMPDFIRELAGATLDEKFYVFGGWAGFGATASAYAVEAGTGPGPAIDCPDDVTATATGGSLCGMSAVVNYPAPTVPQGSTVTCDPPSGSAFPGGTTTVTCTAVDVDGNASTCQFLVTVETPTSACAVDDASGDVFLQVVDQSSVMYGEWIYFVASTREAICGKANRMSYRPGMSLSSSDSDDPKYGMTAQFNYAARTATVQVTDRTTNRRFVLRDRDLGNSVCQ